VSSKALFMSASMPRPTRPRVVDARIALVGRLAILLAIAVHGAVPRGLAAQGAIELAPCDAGQLGQYLGIPEMRCGTLEVFENRRAATGRKLALAIRVLPAIDPDPAQLRPPVFALAGGPGEAATNFAAGAYLALRPAMTHRDLVMVDIRGTGESAPLQCEPLGPPDRAQSWIYYIPPFEEAAHCARVLSEHADLTQYTTAYAADDLNDVRVALGYDRFALAGGSYGTILGQEIIRRHGEHVEVAFLLGIGPPRMAAPMGFARSLETTRERLIADCEADDTCSTAYPEFRADFDEVLARARRGPVQATVTNPIGGGKEDVSLEYGDFAMGIRFLLYSSGAAAALPGQMAAARGGDFGPIMQSITGSVYGIRQVLSYGLFYAMRCTEDLPYVDLEAERTDARGTMLGTYRIDRELENCSAWPRGEPGAHRHDPVVSDVPVLLISGSEDPVTPPEYGDEVAATLPNALHVVFAHRGHGFFDPEAIACLYSIVEPVFASGSTAGVDTSCAAGLDRLPFRVTGS